MFYQPDTQTIIRTKRDLEAVYGFRWAGNPNAEALTGLTPAVTPLTRAERPEVPAGSKAVLQDAPTQDGDAWVLGWDVVSMTTEEQAAATLEIHQQINAERERRLVEGAAFPVTGVAQPIPLNGRPFDQTVYLALLARAQGYKAAGLDTQTLTIRASDDTIHELVPDQMILLIVQAMNWVEAIMARSWAMKDGADASGLFEPADDDLDFSGGIPADFEDDKYWNLPT